MEIVFIPHCCKTESFLLKSIKKKRERVWDTAFRLWGEWEWNFRSSVPLWVSKDQVNLVPQAPCRNSGGLFWQVFSSFSPGFLLCCHHRTEWEPSHPERGERWVAILLSKKGYVLWSSAGGLICTTATCSLACKKKGHSWSDAERKCYCGCCESWNEGLGMGESQIKNWWAVNSDPY